MMATMRRRMEISVRMRMLLPLLSSSWMIFCDEEEEVVVVDERWL